MTSGKLVLTLVIAIMVFGPDKLPMLARHLGKLYCYLRNLKQQWFEFWKEQSFEAALRENEVKAQKADSLYELPAISSQEKINDSSQS